MNDAMKVNQQGYIAALKRQREAAFDEAALLAAALEQAQAEIAVLKLALEQTNEKAPSRGKTR